MAVIKYLRRKSVGLALFKSKFIGESICATRIQPSPTNPVLATHQDLELPLRKNLCFIYSLAIVFLKGECDACLIRLEKRRERFARFQNNNSYFGLYERKYSFVPNYRSDKEIMFIAS